MQQHRQSRKQSLGSGESSERPWRRTTARPRRNSGKPSSEGGELLTSTWDIVGRWREYLEDLHNPTDTPSIEEAEARDSEVGSLSH